MPRKNLPTVFYQQLQALSDGSITPEQHQQLEATLLADAAAREVYYEAVDIDLGLTEIAGGMRPPRTPSAEARPSRTRSIKTALGYSGVAAASLLLGLMIERFLVVEEVADRPLRQQHIAISAPSTQFFATMVRSTDCEWEDTRSPFFEGKRLLSSDLHLHRGVAEFRFDSGVRLVIEGPTRLRVASQTSAFLESGKVVLHGHELADGFDLVTPQGTLTDIGTEYGTTVDENQNVELHVFQGSVQLKPNMAPDSMDIIEAGDAKRLNADSITSVPLRPELFQREVPGRAEGSRISRDGLMAYESFAPLLTNTEKKNDWRSGGMGWQGIWRHEAPTLIPSRAILERHSSLEFPANRLTERDGLIKLIPGLIPGRNIARRKLQHPIRMDTDAIYYVSFHLQKLTELPPGKSQYGSVSLRDSSQPAARRRIVCGMNSERFPLLMHNEQQVQTAPPLNMLKPYFFVAKIVASESAPDQIMMRIFLQDETIPDREPLVWTNMTRPDYDDTVFDDVLLYCEGAEYAFDEIRIASSWEAATYFESAQLRPAATATSNDSSPPPVQ